MNNSTMNKSPRNQGDNKTNIYSGFSPLATWQLGVGNSPEAGNWKVMPTVLRYYTVLRSFVQSLRLPLHQPISDATLHPNAVLNSQVTCLISQFDSLSATRISYSSRRQEYYPVSRLSFIGHRQYIIGGHVISTASLIKSHPLLRLHSRIERNYPPIKHFRNHTLDSPSLLLVFLRAVLPKESAPSDNVCTSMQYTQSK
jgi:hypothetical protein